MHLRSAAATFSARSDRNSARAAVHPIEAPEKPNPASLQGGEVEVPRVPLGGRGRPAASTAHDARPTGRARRRWCGPVDRCSAATRRCPCRGNGAASGCADRPPGRPRGRHEPVHRRSEPRTRMPRPRARPRASAEPGGGSGSRSPLRPPPGRPGTWGTPCGPVAMTTCRARQVPSSGHHAGCRRRSRRRRTSPPSCRR